MSIFDDLKTLTFQAPLAIGRKDARLNFADKDGALYVLLSDLWKYCGMTGDRAAIVSLYVRSKGSSAPRHFIFKGSPPDDALVSREVAVRMVADWCGDAGNTIFRKHPVETMFCEARRAIHGLELIRAIFERAPTGGSSPSFDAVGLQMEVDLVARAMLDHWGKRGSGLPSLGKSQTQFLRKLTMPADAVQRSSKVHREAHRFFRYKADTVFERIQPALLHLSE
jgi:hypothetical protein